MPSGGLAKPREWIEISVSLCRLDDAYEVRCRANKQEPRQGLSVCALVKRCVIHLPRTTTSPDMIARMITNCVMSSVMTSAPSNPIEGDDEPRRGCEEDKRHSY